MKYGKVEEDLKKICDGIEAYHKELLFKSTTNKIILI